MSIREPLFSRIPPAPFLFSPNPPLMSGISTKSEYTSWSTFPINLPISVHHKEDEASSRYQDISQTILYKKTHFNTSSSANSDTIKAQQFRSAASVNVLELVQKWQSQIRSRHVTCSNNQKIDQEVQVSELQNESPPTFSAPDVTSGITVAPKDNFPKNQSGTGMAGSDLEEGMPEPGNSPTGIEERIDRRKMKRFRSASSAQ